VLGASIYAFSTMLAGFLIGIALGGALAAPWARTQRGSARALALTQIGAAAFSFLAFSLLDHLPELAVLVNRPGQLGVLTRASVAAALLLPSTLCIGASFPFAVRALADDVAAAAATSARVYSWNTLGAIVGSISAGFFVIPALGFEHTLAATVLLNLFAAALAAFAVRPLPLPVLALAAACALGLLLVRPGTPFQVISNSTLMLDMSKRGWPSTRRGSSTGWAAPPPCCSTKGREAGICATMGRRNTIRCRAPSRATVTSHGLDAPRLAPGPRDMLVIGLGGGVASSTCRGRPSAST
jgi:hypothetical protein